MVTILIKILFSLLSTVNPKQTVVAYKELQARLAAGYG